MKRLLRDRLIEGVVGPPNYSVWRAGERNQATTRGLHQLFRSHQKVARSESFSRVLHALCRQLESYDRHPSDRLRVSVTTVVTPQGDAVLLPASLFYDPDHLQPRLSRRRFGTLDVPYADLDPATGSVIVDPLHDELTRRLFRLSAREDQEPSWVRPGRYPVRAWMFRTRPEDRFTRAMGVAAAVGLVMNNPNLTGECMLQTLATVMRSARCIGLPEVTASAALRELALGGT